jgi:hypothetical protein
MFSGSIRGAIPVAEKWLTYEELAAASGIGKESARTLVKRKRWARKKGNDGMARIGVPEELIEARIVPRAFPGMILRASPRTILWTFPRSIPRTSGRLLAS